MTSFRRVRIAALVAAPTIVGLVVLVYLPLVGGDRVVAGSGRVLVSGPVELYYGSDPSPSGREVTTFDIGFDLNSYNEPVVDTPLQYADVTIHNLSEGPVRVESQDTFAPGYVGLMPFDVPGSRGLYLRPGEMCFAQLGIAFTSEQWRALKPGDYPFEVTIVAQPSSAAGGVQAGDDRGTLMPCSSSVGARLG